MKIQKKMMNTKIIVCLTAFVCLANYVNSHSLKMSSMTRKRLMANEKNSYNEPESYHIHIQYQWENIELYQRVLDLVNSFKNDFNLANVEPCKAVYEDIRLCEFGS